MNTHAEFDLVTGILITLIVIGVIIGFVIMWQTGVLGSFADDALRLVNIFS